LRSGELWCTEIGNSDFSHVFVKIKKLALLQASLKNVKL
jgi:hypothetical protein